MCVCERERESVCVRERERERVLNFPRYLTHSLQLVARNICFTHTLLILYSYFTHTLLQTTAEREGRGVGGNAGGEKKRNGGVE